MAKFKVGDRIVTKSGTHGKVVTVLDDNYYAVQFDGREMSKVHESVMKAENSIVSTNAVVANALAAHGKVANNAVVTLIVGAKDQIKREIDNIKQLESDVSRVDGIESEVVRLIGMAHKSLAEAYRKI